MWKWKFSSVTRNLFRSSSSSRYKHQTNISGRLFLPSFISSTSEWLLMLILMFSTLSNTSQECPTDCECKWKSGKESVTCSRARLRIIPQGLDPNTQVLELPGNLIERLPSKVFLKLNLLNLQKIFLSDCQLVTLTSDTFAKLSNLIELELSGNRLEMIPSHTFEYISELRELKLNSNPIVRISNDAFVALPRLVRLELTGCRLGTIETWAFRGLPSLQWLRLDNNRLLTIQAESFFPLRSLHGLEIAGNPWNCSCTLQPWREWLIKNNVPFGVPPLCFYPKRLEGKSWNQLQVEDFACLPKLTSSTDQERIIRVVEGENGTLLCRLHTTPDTQIRWLSGNKGTGVPVTNGSVGTISSSSSSPAFVLTESFVKSGSTLSMENGSSNPSSQVVLDEFANHGTRRRTSSSSSSDRSLGFKISKLTVIRATLREAGLYICTAETKAGLISANFTLQVLQTKTENFTGRLLFTGALVAAFLLFIVCLLLVCVIVGSRRLQYSGSRSASRTMTEDKIELNNIGHHNNHVAAEPNHFAMNQLHHHTNRNHSNAAAGSNPSQQNGGNSIPLMRKGDLGDEEELDGENELGGESDQNQWNSSKAGVTSHYFSRNINDRQAQSQPRQQHQQTLENRNSTMSFSSCSMSNSISTGNNNGSSNKNLTTLTTSAKKPSFGSSSRNGRPLSDTGRTRRTRRNGSGECRYKALAADEGNDDDSNDDDPEEAEDEDEEDEGDNNSESEEDDRFGAGRGESGDESCTPVEIVNNNLRTNKNVITGASFPAGAASKVSVGHHNNSRSNVNSSGSHINKRQASTTMTTGSCNNSNNNNNTGPLTLLTKGTTVSSRGREMRSNPSGGNPQKPIIELMSATSNSTGASFASGPSQQYNLQYENSSNTKTSYRYPDLIDDRLPFSGTDYTSLPRSNKNRDPRVGSYFHRRNNSTDSQYPLLSSSRGNSLETMCSTELATATPFVSCSNPDSLSKVPSISYLSSCSRPPSAYLSQQYQHRMRHQHSGSGGHLPKYSSIYSSPAVAHPSDHVVRWNSFNQRLSMPTSPVHQHFHQEESPFSPSSVPPATYDYHAAQLAAFLEEYRTLQMELIRMSSSLTTISNNNSFSNDDYKSTNVNNQASEVDVGGKTLATHTPNNNNTAPSPCSTNNASSSTSHYNNPHGRFHEQSNQISVISAASNCSGLGNNVSPSPAIGSVTSLNRYQQFSSDNSSRNPKYFTNNAFGLSRPPSSKTSSQTSLLGSSSNSSSTTDFHPTKFQYHQSNLKSILKNTAANNSNLSECEFVNSKNSNNNNNYMA